MGRIAARLIAMAVALTGSTERVRAELKCSRDEFRDFSAGRRKPTQPQMETLLSVILRERQAMIATSRQLIAKMRGKTPR